MIISGSVLYIYIYIYTVILYVHIVFAPAGAIVTIFQGEGTPNDHLLNTRSRVTNKGQSWKLTNALGVQTYSGFRVDGTGTQRCLLYGDPHKPPFGECAIYSETTVHFVTFRMNEDSRVITAPPRNVLGVVYANLRHFSHKANGELSGCSETSNRVSSNNLVARGKERYHNRDW